jgi:hypothetical protein
VRVREISFRVMGEWWVVGCGRWKGEEGGGVGLGWDGVLVLGNDGCLANALLRDE